MPKSAEALIKSDLLRWARDTAGLSILEAAPKAGVTADRVESWEKGQARPSVAQLRKLASIYKRPLAAFYLAEPPEAVPLLRDFRRPSTAARPQSPELRLAHRQALHRRGVALDLFEELGDEPPTFRVSASLSQDPEDLGIYIRSLLHITSENQSRWRDPYAALNAWRSACEDMGALVCHASRVKPDEMSGFSISELPLPVVVVNIKDPPQRRIFTLLHELAHLATRQGGLCDLDEGPGRGRTEQDIEVFCNHVAGAVLVPMEDLLIQEVVRSRSQPGEWRDDEIRMLTNRYSVSRETVLRRLLVARLTTLDFYREKREEFRTEYEQERDEASRKRRGRASVHQAAINKAGPFFARLVLGAYYENRITASDVSEYLGIRLKHLPRVETELFSPAGGQQA